MNFLLVLALVGAAGDRIAGVVDDAVILKSELDAAVAVMKMQPGVIPPPDSVLYPDILNQLIANQLLLKEATKETVDVSKDEIKAELARTIATLKERFPSQKEYTEALQAEGLTEESLQERYTGDVRNRILVQKLLAKKGLTQIYIAPTEVHSFYDKNKDSIAVEPGRAKLAHILFLITPTPAEETAVQKRISEIYGILLGGGDFEVVAQSFSEDPNTKNKGGYLGLVKPGDLVPEVDSILATLKSGQMSAPFRSRFGYQIVKCDKRTKTGCFVRHILIPVAPARADTLRVQRLARSVRERALKGENFQTLAKQYSEDPQAKETDGELGEFLLKGLTAPFDQVVAELDSGEISEPVLSPFGYHIVKILDTKPERHLSYEEMVPQIRDYLYQAKLKERLDDLVAEIAKTTYVEKFP
jgi:peptidyl-prolyl cis-trans isomerase SurA